MRTQTDTRDKLTTRQPKGLWLRFLKVFLKCRLPWVFLILYLILEMGLITLGVSETDYTAQLFAGDTSPQLVLQLVAIIVINLVGSNLLVFVRGITSARIIRNTQEVLLEKVFRLPMSYFQSENPREEVHRIVNRSLVVDSTIMLVLIPIYSAAFKIVSIAGRVTGYDWRLTLVLIGFVPVQVLIAVIFGRLNFTLAKKDVEVNTTLTRKLGELITNIPLAKAFAQEEREEKKAREYTERLYRLNITGSWLGQFKDISESITNLIQSLVIVGVGMVLLRNAEITKRAWISFYLYSATFSGAITEFMMYWNNLKTIQGGADTVAEVLDAKDEDRSGAACSELSGDLKVEDLCFSYEEGKQILNHLSCTFPDHSVTGLVGLSGSGKSTLTHLLTRLYPAESGSIKAGDTDVSTYALNDYRKHFEVVSQTGLLFRGTVRENLCYGKGDVSEDVLIDALKKAQAYDFVMAMPNGLDSMLGEYGGNLSGGQRQRLALVRALLSDAHYLILDEPVASMDALATAELLDILRTVTEDRCTIIIGHSASILPLTDRVVVLENGVVTGEGRTEEVLEKNCFLRQMCGKEAAV